MANLGAQYQRDDDATVRNLAAYIMPAIFIGLANAEYYKVYSKLKADGLLGSIYATFDINAVVWMGFWLLFELGRKIQTRNLPFLWISSSLSILSILVLIPISGASWVGLSFFSVCLFLWGAEDDYRRRTAWLLGALCVNGFWSPLVFRFFTDAVLSVDAMIIGFATGATVNGNLIRAADGQTTLQVLAACSSFSNISLAVLGWIIGRTYFGTWGIQRAALFLPLSIASVVLVNTIRIGVIALRPDLYDLAHGSVGSNIASLASASLIYTITYYGTRK